jgi:hypothetical protein
VFCVGNALKMLLKFVIDFMTHIKISLLVCALYLAGCKKDTVKPDPCAHLVPGVVVGFHQCALTTGFIIAVTNPPDTVETFNLPDSLFHFPTDAGADIYKNYIKDFLFPAAQQGRYIFSVAFDEVPTKEKILPLCADNISTAHYVHTVKRQVKITCATKK